MDFFLVCKAYSLWSKFCHKIYFSMASVMPLCQNQALLLDNVMIYTLGSTLKDDASKFPTWSPFICRAKGKGDVFFFKKIGFDWSGDITEGKEVSDWKMYFGQCCYGPGRTYFLGTRTWKSSSEDKKFKEGSSRCGAELGCDHSTKIWNYLSVRTCFFQPMWNQSLRNAGCIHIP